MTDAEIALLRQLFGKETQAFLSKGATAADLAALDPLVDYRVEMRKAGWIQLEVAKAVLLRRPVGEGRLQHLARQAECNRWHG